MELTPQAVSEAEFREAKRGGYNIRDVDDFLDRVAVGVGQLQERIREAYHRAEVAESRLVDLQRQLEEARQAAARGPESMGGAPQAPSPETDDTLRRTLVLAQRTADATIKEAKDEAARILEDAREEAARAHASAEANALGDVNAAREQAQHEVERLIDRRDEVAGEIAKLEDHLAAQRDNLRAGIEDLLQLLDGHPSLRLDPPPAVSDMSSGPPEVPVTPPESGNGQAVGNGFVPGARLSSTDLPSPAPNPDFSLPSPPGATPPGAQPLLGDSFGAEPERPPLPSRENARELWEPEPLPSREPLEAPLRDPLPSREPLESREPPALDPLPSREPLESREPPALDPLPSREPLEPRDPLPSREPLEPREPLPRRDGSNVAALQEPPSGPGGNPPSDDGRSIFPSSLGPPPGATGFLPDLNLPEPSPEQPSERSGLDALDGGGFPGPPSPSEDGLSLPIDGPPPPPPPPGLDHLRDAAPGGIPVESGSRPSEWGRGVFDEEAEEDSNGTRFGRP